MLTPLSGQRKGARARRFGHRPEHPVALGQRLRIACQAAKSTPQAGRPSNRPREQARRSEERGTRPPRPRRMGTGRPLGKGRPKRPLSKRRPITADLLDDSTTHSSPRRYDAGRANPAPPTTRTVYQRAQVLPQRGQGWAEQARASRCESAAWMAEDGRGLPTGNQPAAPHVLELPGRGARDGTLVRWQDWQRTLRAVLPGVRGAARRPAIRAGLLAAPTCIALSLSR
jgi:hypothetical protein